MYDLARTTLHGAIPALS